MPESRLEGLGGHALFWSFNILMSLQAWLLPLSVLLVLALAEGCSLGSSCFSFSEKLPIRADLSATRPCKKGKEESLASGASKGFGISSLSSKDLLRRINWNKYISRGGGAGEGRL